MPDSGEKSHIEKARKALKDTCHYSVPPGAMGDNLTYHLVERAFDVEVYGEGCAQHAIPPLQQRHGVGAGLGFEEFGRSFDDDGGERVSDVKLSKEVSGFL